MGERSLLDPIEGHAQGLKDWQLWARPAGTPPAPPGPSVRVWTPPPAPHSYHASTLMATVCLPTRTGHCPKQLRVRASLPHAMSLLPRTGPLASCGPTMPRVQAFSCPAGPCLTGPTRPDPEHAQLLSATLRPPPVSPLSACGPLDTGAQAPVCRSLLSADHSWAAPPPACPAPSAPQPRECPVNAPLLL